MSSLALILGFGLLGLTIRSGATIWAANYTAFPLPGTVSWTASSGPNWSCTTNTVAGDGCGAYPGQIALPAGDFDLAVINTSSGAGAINVDSAIPNPVTLALSAPNMTVDVVTGTATGAITLTGASSVTATSGTAALSVDGGHLTNVGTLNLGIPSTFNLNFGTFDGGGSTTVNGVFNITGTASPVLVNAQSILVASTSTASFQVPGTLQMGANASMNNQTPLFIVGGGATVSSGGAASFNNAGGLNGSGGAFNVAIPFANTGTAAVSTIGGSSFSFTGGSGTGDANATWNLGTNGIINFGGAHVLGGSESFSGVGTININPGGSWSYTGGGIPGTININNNGSLDFGSTPQTFDFGGNYTQSATGTFKPKFGPALSSDQLVISGTATLGGTLAPIINPTYTPANGDIFLVVSCPTGCGSSFTTYVPIPYPGGAFLMVNTGTAIQLVATPTADVSILNAGPPTVLDGQNATFTLTVGNVGPTSPATVTVTDSFVGGTFVSATPSTGSCVGVTSPITCTMSLATGPPQTISVVLKGTPSGTLTNTASVSVGAPVVDTNLANNGPVVATTTVVPAADLSVASPIGTSANPINAGATETFTVNVGNAGPDPASTATVTLGLTGGTIVSAIGPPWVCSGTTTLQTCNATTFNLGTTPITVTTTAQAQAGTMTLNASISSLTGDPVLANNGPVPASVTVNPITNLTIAKSVATPPTAGGNVVYTITVNNAGPSDAAGVVITDPTPAGLTFVSASAPCAAGFPCSLGTVLAGTSVPITATYSIPSSMTGTISNTANVTTTTPNSATAASTSATAGPTAIVTSADLAIAKLPPAFVDAGANATYTITVTNIGPSDATTVTVSDPTLAPLTFVSNSGACTTPFPCSIASIPKGTSATINSTYSVPSNASGFATNTATVSATTPDPVPGNNSSTATTPITVKADMSVTKTGPAIATLGSNVTYTITVTNLGPSDATGVSLADPTPAGLTFVSATGACTSFPCAIGAVTALTSKTVQATYTVNSTSPVTNSATVSATTLDINPANNTASVTTSTSCPSSAPANASPSDGSSNVPTSGVLSWSNVGASSYTVYLDVATNANACTKFFGSTSRTSIPYFGLQQGTVYQWRVVAGAGSCAPKATSCMTFTTASSCPLAAPTLISPINSTVVGPVTFKWNAAPGAVDYKLFVNNVQLASITDGTSFGPTSVGSGPITWYVVADFASPCPSLQSAAVSFNGCDNTIAPVLSVVGKAASGQGYDVTWKSITGATQYQIDEATDPAFTGPTTQTVTATTVHFVHTVTTPTGFYYRVRAFLPCANGYAANSIPVRVVLTPISSGNNVSVPTGNSTLVTVVVHVPGFPDGTFPFTATLDKPWLVSVDPSSGLLPPEGIDLTVTANPTGLPDGTITGTVILSVSTPKSGLFVTNGVTPVSAPVSISLVTPVTPTSPGAPSPNALIIPSVGHLDGINSHWQSDIRVANTSSTTAHYQLTFTPDDISKGVRQTIIDVGPGATTALDDIINTWYGVGTLGETANGVLAIAPAQTSGKSDSVSVSLATVASSRTYNLASNGTFGEFIPAIPFANFVSAAVDANHTPTILGLQQIAQSSAYRTNVGVVEASGHPASVLISAFDDAGNKLLDFPVALQANQQLQLNSFLAQNKISLSDGRLQVQVVNGNGQITAYASVIDNATGDPLLVSGVPLGQLVSDHYIVPGVADLNTGLAVWRSDIRVFNTSSSAQFVTATFYPQSGGGPPQTASFTVNPGQTKALDSALNTLFGSPATNNGGAIHFTLGNPASLVVTGRTYNQTANGTFGQFIPAVTSADAVGNGDRALQILQAEDSSRYRTNVGIAEVTGQPATVQVSVVLPDSKVSPSTQIPLAANGFIQIPVIESLGLSNVYNARITVSVVGGTGKVAAYGSLIDQKTQAPTYIPAQ